MFGFGKLDKLQAKNEIVKLSLKEMFKDTHFSICTLDKCLRIAKIIPNHEDYEMLHALHCVHWDVMKRKVRNWVQVTVVEMFSAAPEDMDAVLEALDINRVKALALAELDNAHMSK